MASFNYNGYSYNLTSLYEFINEFNIRNNEIANEKNLNKPINKLKRELNQIIGQIKILTSQESIRWSSLITYEPGEIVSYFAETKPEYTKDEIENSYYIALPTDDTNIAVPPATSAKFWQKITIQDLFPNLYLNNYALKNQETADWQAVQDYAVVNIKKLKDTLEEFKASLDTENAEKFIKFQNTKNYDISHDFQPTTKKYVDDKITELNSSIANVQNLLGNYVRIEGSNSKMQTTQTGYVNAFATPNQGLLPGVANQTNLGSASKKFNIVYANIFEGIATKAQYADLAEVIETELEFLPGTILSLDPETQDFVYFQPHLEVFGVVSSKPGLILNSEAQGVLIAHKGQVPVKVKGPVLKGQIIIASGGGYGIAVDFLKDNERHLKIGIALESSNEARVKLINTFI